MAVEPPRNSFRAFVIRGERPPLLVTEKEPKLDASDEALDWMVPRSAGRRGNHRGKDRHRLTGTTASARYEGKRHRVEVINLSAGGAMIRAGFAPRLWDMVVLELGEGHSIEGAVRWLKDGLVGLEFAHETRIDCDPEQHAALLLEVIQRSFPDVPVRLDGSDEAKQPLPDAGEEAEHRVDKRHPLIWSGVLHYAHNSHPVRLRNISSGGALLDVPGHYVEGAEVVLDLGEAGELCATVSWSHGEQVGLKFHEPFDVASLAKAKPEVTPQRWVKPSFLDKAQDDYSPWHSKWSRSSITEIRTELEGFLKR